MQADTSSVKKRSWWKSTAAFLLLIAPILAVVLAQWDYRIVAWVSQRHLPGDIEKALQLSEAFAHGSGVIAIFAILLAVDTTQRRKILSMLLMVITIMVVANSCKLIVSRSRPNAFQDVTEIKTTWNSKSQKKGYDTTVRSFPSGHSATAVAMAFALANLYPRGRYLFVLLCVTACFQRIASRSHFPSDVMGGASVAAAITLIWQNVFPHYFGTLKLDKDEIKSEDVPSVQQ